MNHTEKKTVSRTTSAEVPSERKEQAREIMQQLVAEGVFAPGEAAEVTFSDSKIIAVPEDDSTSNKPSENE